MASLAAPVNRRHTEIRQRLLQDHPSLATTQQTMGVADSLNLQGDSQCRHALWARYAAHQPADEKPAVFVEINRDGDAGGDRDGEHSQDNSTGNEAVAVHRQGQTTRAQAAFGPAYFADEQTIRPDHSWNYVATNLNQLPANSVRNRGFDTRFTEYPRLQRLLELKRQHVDASASPSTYLAADLRQSLTPPPPSHLTGGPFHLATLIPVKYDVVLIDAPLSCYEWNSVPSSSNVESQQTWSWEDISELPISLLAAKESFVFLWVGPGCSDGLERGRETLTRWGYRRCEVITWCITSPDNSAGRPYGVSDGGGALASTAVHCLMGIRGTVRRSKDGNYVHCNVDADVIFWDGEASPVSRCAAESREDVSNAPIDLRLKPPELYTIIENFCQGTRRVELFGTNRNLRRGWLTIGHPSTLGPDALFWGEALRGENAGAVATQWSTLRHAAGSEATLSKPEEYSKRRYDSYFKVDPVGCSLGERSNIVPYSEAIESLRPRTPSAQGGRAGGRSAEATTPTAATSWDPLAAVVDTALVTHSRSSGVGGWNSNGTVYKANDRHGLPRGLGISSCQQRQPSRSTNDDRSGFGIPTSSPPSVYQHFSGRPADATGPLPTDGQGGSSRAGPPSYRSPTAGLGAGGPVTVSVQSGSETLSGPQKSAIGLGLGVPAGASHLNNAGRSGAATGPRSSGGRRQGRGGARTRGSPATRAASGKAIGPDVSDV